MFSVNTRKLYRKAIWRDYVNDVQNLEKYAIDFFYLIKNLGRPNDNMQYDRNRIKIE